MSIVIDKDDQLQYTLHQFLYKAKETRGYGSKAPLIVLLHHRQKIVSTYRLWPMIFRPVQIGSSNVSIDSFTTRLERNYCENVYLFNSTIIVRRTRADTPCPFLSFLSCNQYLSLWKSAFSRLGSHIVMSITLLEVLQLSGTSGHCEDDRVEKPTVSMLQ